MLTAINESTGKVQNAATNSAGRLLSEQTPRYLDLGLIVDGSAGGNGYQLATDAVATVSAVDNIDWARNMNIFLKTDSATPPELRINCINKDGVEALCVNGITLWASTTWMCKQMLGAVSGVSSNASSVMGKTAKITIKNKGVSAANIWMAIQLLG